MERRSAEQKILPYWKVDIQKKFNFLERVGGLIEVPGFTKKQI